MIHHPWYAILGCFMISYYMIVLKNQKTITVLFLLYFIVYSVSPLSSGSSVGRSDELSYVPQKSHFFANPNLFFLNEFLSIFGDREGQDDTTSTQILLKRKKVVIQSTNLLERTPLSLFQVVSDDYDYHFLPLFGKKDHQGTPKPYLNFLSVFSGLSPPSI